MTITLKLDDTKTITLETHEIESQTLYKSQDLLTGYGLEGKRMAKKMENWSISKNYPKTGVVKLEGRGGGTYLTKRNLLKLAGYISYEFEDAVYEAFELLSENKVSEAIEVTKSVINVHEVTLSKRPASNIRKYLEEFSTISEGVKAWIAAAGGNKKASYEDRVRTMKSLRYIVDESYDNLSAREHAKAGQHEEALKMIAEEERRLARIKASGS